MNSLLSISFIGLSFIAINCSTIRAHNEFVAWKRTQTAIRPEKIQMTIVSVRPDMTADFENLIKNELNPGIAKGGAKWNDVWRDAAFGNSFDYFFVTPIDDYAQFDGASPLIKGLGNEGGAAFFTKVGKLISGSRSLAYEKCDGLSYSAKLSELPKMAVFTYTRIAPGKSKEYDRYVKNVVLPFIQKSDIAGYTVWKTSFGGNENEYLTIMQINSFADLEKSSPTDLALSSEGVKRPPPKLSEGVVIFQESYVKRYAPDLSYRPASLTQNDSLKTIVAEPKKEIFIVTYQPGTAWIKGKPVTEQPLKEHGKFLLELYKSKILISAGPFGDDSGGAAVIEVSNADEAKKIVERDPAVTSKVMIYEIHPWKLVPWENYVKK